ncbi:MAG: AI-2E family transporter [Firmicutes bacterium]|nr:AI-2E family transporter [Bacillota bacterium]
MPLTNLTKKQKLFTFTAIFIALFALLNYTVFRGALGRVLSAFQPVFLGIIFALILNGPVKFFEKTVFKWKRLKRIRRALSLFLTLTIISGAVLLAVLLIAPKVSESLTAFKGKITEFSAVGIAPLFESSPFLHGIITKFSTQIDSLISRFRTNYLGGERVLGLLKGGLNVIIGLGLAVLAILSKDKLAQQAYRLLTHFRGEISAKKTLAVTASATHKFSLFLGGQIIEAVIFGVSCYIALTLLKVPYAPLASVILGIGNLIPIVGALSAGIASFLLVFTLSPEKAVIGLIAVIIIQQVEQLTTYPVIVGKYVGISAFWTLFAVAVGGALFGFWGLVLGVPTVAFVDNLMRVLYADKYDTKPPERNNKKLFFKKS